MKDMKGGLVLPGDEQAHRNSGEYVSSKPNPESGSASIEVKEPCQLMTLSWHAAVCSVGRRGLRRSCGRVACWNASLQNGGTSSQQPLHPFYPITQGSFGIQNKPHYLPVTSEGSLISTCPKR